MNALQTTSHNWRYEAMGKEEIGSVWGMKKCCEDYLLGIMFECESQDDDEMLMMTMVLKPGEYTCPTCGHKIRIHAFSEKKDRGRTSTLTAEAREILKGKKLDEIL